MDELRRWLDSDDRPGIEVVGEGRSLTASWLVRRELVTGSPTRVAINNVGFIGPGERRTLLRNALHWLSANEREEYWKGLPRSFATKTAMVRTTALRADKLVVPCTAMAERVASEAPHLANRLVVRHHPLSPVPAPDDAAPRHILVPVLLAGYKRMDQHLLALSAALSSLENSDTRVRLTALADDVPAEVASDPRFDLLGPLATSAMAAEWKRSTVIYYPTGMESFGYPVAEARASGRFVVAQGTEQNREIAGASLRGFNVGDHDSLVAAVESGLSMPLPTPDPLPFDPGSYFGDVLSTGNGQL